MVKHEGRIHKRSLETADVQSAKNNLKDFVKEVESKDDALPDVLFQDFTKRRLEGIKPNLKDLHQPTEAGIR